MSLLSSQRISCTTAQGARALGWRRVVGWVERGGAARSYPSKTQTKLKPISLPPAGGARSALLASWGARRPRRRAEGASSPPAAPPAPPGPGQGEREMQASVLEAGGSTARAGRGGAPAVNKARYSADGLGLAPPASTRVMDRTGTPWGAGRLGLCRTTDRRAPFHVPFKHVGLMSPRGPLGGCCFFCRGCSFLLSSRGLCNYR